VVVTVCVTVEVMTWIVVAVELDVGQIVVGVEVG
jgi:hypothetical protein